MLCVCGQLSVVSYCAFNKVVRRHYSGEVGEFIIFLCEISAGYCTTKITEIDSVFIELFKI